MSNLKSSVKISEQQKELSIKRAYFKKEADTKKTKADAEKYRIEGKKYDSSNKCYKR